MSILIRLLQPHEYTLANDFFNVTYKTNRSLKDFEWEFSHGPFGPAIYVVAIDQEVTDTIKVVGIQCAIPISLVNSAGDRVMTAKSEDTLVDPSYRGQKIFERMYEMLFDACKNAGIKYIWGFTPARKAFERIGFQIPFQAHQALMVMNPRKAYAYLSRLNPSNKRIDKLKIAGLTFLSRLASRVVPNPPDLELKRTAFYDKQHTLKALAPNGEMFYLDMTTDYLEWRLKRNPFGNNYDNFQILQNGKLVADALINTRLPRLGYVEQIIFGEGLNENDKQKIVGAIVRELKYKVDLIRVLCFDANDALIDQEQLFKRSGFIILKRGGYFVWKELEPAGLEPNKLFLSRLFTQGNQ
ncbi:GNAT family N-acetyltransferase [Chryseolinea sp. T2]|uniref:GNAT family N-acetyltransferase n=1 Tax=Chryseolinea sp. T2 TaxID=3129255 RepID=UPI003077340D